jgi:predicted enzyme related to lactoylglutathione lyase
MKKLALACLMLTLSLVSARADQPKQGSAVMWFDLHVSSLQRSTSFYGPLFGWQFVEKELQGYHFALVKADGRLIGGLNPVARPANAMPSTSIYFPVDDLKASFEKAKSLGATVVFEPMNIPGDDYEGSIAMVNDPDGNPIGLLSTKKLP